MNSWGSASCNQTNTWAGDGPQVPPVVKSVPGGVFETWKICSLVPHVTLIYNTYTIHVPLCFAMFYFSIYGRKHPLKCTSDVQRPTMSHVPGSPAGYQRWRPPRKQTEPLVLYTSRKGVASLYIIGFILFLSQPPGCSSKSAIYQPMVVLQQSYHCALLSKVAIL